MVVALWSCPYGRIQDIFRHVGPNTHHNLNTKMRPALWVELSDLGLAWQFSYVKIGLICYTGSACPRCSRHRRERYSVTTWAMSYLYLASIISTPYIRSPIWIRPWPARIYGQARRTGMLERIRNSRAKLLHLQHEARLHARTLDKSTPFYS